jgi:hypothetical protein
MLNKKILITIGIIALIIGTVFYFGFFPKERETVKPADLSQVKVAVQYRWVTDWQNIAAVDRTLDDVINIFKETNADFIFQGWLTQQPLPDKCSDLTQDMQKKCEENGYSYEYLKNAIPEIKKELPNIIFCGGRQFEYFYPDEVSGRDKAWNMTLNPPKWGFKEGRRYAQCFWAKQWGFVGAQQPCPSEEILKQKMLYYFPDITNPDFQKVFLARIYRQIDAGVDAIWIDMLYVQPALLKELAKDENHPAVQESYKAVWEIVDKIHQYGLSKGRYVYVITWVAVERAGSIIIFAPETNVDVAMVSAAPDEIRNKITGEIGQFKEELWDELVQIINERYKIPIFARIDYGGIWRSPLTVFSQELSPTEASEFLNRADEFFSSKGITFIYPVHGGILVEGGTPETLSYGRFNWYDSLAPEFQTYETIKELAQNKK